MSIVTEKLRNTLAPTGLSITKNTYSGDDPVYLTYNYTTLGDQYGNNRAQVDRFLLSVHLIAPANYDIEALELQIKTLLEDAGYPRPSVTDATDDPAEEQHRVFETEDDAANGAE